MIFLVLQLIYGYTTKKLRLLYVSDNENLAEHMAETGNTKAVTYSQNNSKNGIDN